MNNKEIKGTINIFDNTFYFSYLDFKLIINLESNINLFFSTDKTKKYFIIDHQPLVFDFLAGNNDENGSLINFYFSKSNYTISYTFNNFGTFFTLTIYVDRVIIFDHKCDTKGTVLNFFSDQFYRFLSMKPSFKRTAHGIFSVDFNYPSLRYETEFEIEEHKITTRPGYMINYHGTILKMIPCLHIVTDSTDIDFIFKLYDTVLILLKFLFMRTDIFPNSVDIEMNGWDGEIFSSNVSEVDYVPEDYNTMSKTDSIPWQLVYKKIGKIIALVYEKSIYLNHIPKTLDERFSFNSASMSKIAAAFESEFTALYPDGIPLSKDKQQAIAKVTEKIQELIQQNKGKAKDIYKMLLKFIDHVTLANKIEYSLKDNNQGLLDIKKLIRCSMNNKKIASNCAKYRNDIDHGKKIDHYEDGIGKAFLILNCLIYAMQLRRSGYSPDEINIILPYFYNYH